MSEEKSRKVLDGTLKIDKSQGEFVGRAGLTYQGDNCVARQQVRNYPGMHCEFSRLKNKIGLFFYHVVLR